MMFVALLRAAGESGICDALPIEGEAAHERIRNEALTLPERAMLR